MDRVYLDYNATNPLRAQARQAMVAALDIVGNPSSVHAEGRAAKSLIENARRDVAALVGCAPAEVVFTSGATEAARVLAPLSKHYSIRVDPTAHDALLAYAGKPDTGTISERQVLSMGLANSETGIINPLPNQQAGTWHSPPSKADLLMLDITQAAARIAFDFQTSGADLAILSAHKLGGPKGIGALIVRQGLDIESLSLGGGQEMGRRSGTENLVGIAGFGAAAVAAKQDFEAGRWDEIKELRKILENALAAEAKTTIFVGIDADRLPNTTCMVTPGWKGEAQVIQMDLAGFAISAGSACSSGKVRASSVLRAMGFEDATASCAIRVSLGLETTKDQVLRFAQTWLDKEQKFRARAA